MGFWLLTFSHVIFLGLIYSYCSETLKVHVWAGRPAPACTAFTSCENAICSIFYFQASKICCCGFLNLIFKIFLPAALHLEVMKMGFEHIDFLWSFI